MNRLFARWLCVLYGGWFTAWCLFRFLETRVTLLQDPLVATAWWTVAKLVVWVLPVLVFSRFIPLGAGSLRLHHLRGVPLALAVSCAWVALNATGDWLLGRTPAPAMGPGVLSAAFIAPFVEELVFRGFAFAWLEVLGFGFWKANLTCALLFALLHVPGWIFMQGAVVVLLGQFAQTALLGFGFGLLRRGDASLWGPITLHFANNAWSGGLIRWLIA